MKAAYGTFMTALTTLWLSDKLADEMAPQLNVTWSRNMPTVVMSGVNSNGAYVHSSDASMGRDIQGSQNKKFFNFLCSLMLSDIEQVALGNAGLNVTSTVSEIVIGILNGKHFQVVSDEANGIVILTLDDNPNLKIVIDLATGLVKDIVDDGSFQYKGSTASDDAYCYHQQRTDRLTKGISDFLSSPEGQHTLASVGGSMLIAAGLVALGPAGWAVGGALIIGGLLSTAYGSGVLEDPGDYRNWLDFGVSAGLSCLGPEAVGIKTAVSASYRSTVKYCVGQRGSRVIAEEAWLGRDGAVSTCDYIRQQAIGVDSSYIIHQLPAYNQ